MFGTGDRGGDPVFHRFYSINWLAGYLIMLRGKRLDGIPKPRGFPTWRQHRRHI